MTPLEAQCRWLMRGPAEVWQGDNLAALAGIPDNSIDAIITDPPYGLGKEPDALAMLRDWMTEGHHDHKGGAGFMGKKWDAFVPQPALWRECFRVLKPGGHVLAFAGTRTQDLMCLGLRIAGFEIRDVIAWVYGSGFPKSLDVGKAIDKAAGAEREAVGSKTVSRDFRSGEGEDVAFRSGRPGQTEVVVTAPATEAARRWHGWGTALKPALEPITLARKPLSGTVAANVLAHGTGALNIDGCRVGTSKSVPASVSRKEQGNCYGKFVESGETQGVGGHDPNLGRWPANLIHDGSEEVVGRFPESKGQQGNVRGTEASRTGGDGTNCYGEYGRVESVKRGDAGSAARFFYCAKASKRDRDEGNTHPTVKPTDLMRYLCRLVTPPGGLVLDPFAGSGSTGKAAVLEGFRFLGLELDPDYAAIAEARLRAAR